MTCLPGLAAAILLATQGAHAPRSEPKMPITGLAPAVYVPDLCLYRYPVSTRSADCQKFCDQAFGYFYSYVWMEAARSFETALSHDPDCAVAWLGLANALEKWGKSFPPKPDALYAAGGTGLAAKLPPRYGKPPTGYALEKAKELLPKASHREQLLVTAKLHEKGMMAGTGPDDRRRKAQQTLDELLTLYPDDEEGWFAPRSRTGRTARRRTSTPCCGSTRTTPGRTTSSSTSTRRSAGRRSAGRMRRGTSSPRRASRTPSTCRPTWRCGSASGRTPPTGRGRRSSWRRPTTSCRTSSRPTTTSSSTTWRR